mgnify:CR=1 FL=1
MFFPAIIACINGTMLSVNSKPADDLYQNALEHLDERLVYPEAFKV